MNAEDSQVSMPEYENKVSLQIFPLGIFCFEETILERLFEVLHVTVEGKADIIRIIKFPAIPIINIFNYQIQREGPIVHLQWNGQIGLFDFTEFLKV